MSAYALAIGKDAALQHGHQECQHVMKIVYTMNNYFELLIPRFAASSFYHTETAANIIYNDNEFFLNNNARHSMDNFKTASAVRRSVLDTIISTLACNMLLTKSKQCELFFLQS